MKLKPIEYKNHIITVIKLIDGRGRRYDVYDVDIRYKMLNGKLAVPKSFHTHSNTKEQVIREAKKFIDTDKQPVSWYR